MNHEDKWRWHNTTKKLMKNKKTTSIAASKFLNACFEAFRKHCAAVLLEKSLETSVISSDTTNEVINDLNWKRTINSKSPKSGHSYTALKVHSSKGFICTWVWKVQDRFILNLRLLRRLFELNRGICPLKIIHQSEGEIDLVGREEVDSRHTVDVGEKNRQNVFVFESDCVDSFE